MKVTEAQADLLRAMQRGVDVRYNRTHGYWYRSDTGNRVGAVAMHLKRNGYIHPVDERYEFTPTGRNWRPPTTEHT